MDMVEQLIDDGKLKGGNPHTEDFARDYLEHMRDGGKEYGWFRQSDLDAAMSHFEEELYSKAGAVLGIGRYEAQGLSVKDPEAFEKAQSPHLVWPWSLLHRHPRRNVAPNSIQMTWKEM